ncbi:MAG: hypothetical protein QM741_11475 [Rudaea sp.]|uniref:dioxygenase family protein n=1 Tax=Rudaea sp. TaxID=2136325 RepID=UPI0039E445B3
MPIRSFACNLTPQETSGPYPGDGTNGPNVLTQSGIVRSDIRSSFGSAGTDTAAGTLNTVTLRISSTTSGTCGAIAGLAVYIWHCNANGSYSLYSSGITSENYLRGVQVTDANGEVTFTSIFPACYSGRWPHIHIEVYSSLAQATSGANAISTTQLAMPQSACSTVYAQTSLYPSSASNLSKVSLATDNVFGDDDAEYELATVTGSNAAAGWNTYLEIGVAADATSTSSAGYVPLNPSRILDTRTGAHTSDDQFAAIGALTPGQTLNLTVLGRGGVPSSGVKAVVLNLTVTAPTAAGYVTAWPSGTSKPTTSNINFVAGQTIPNLIIVGVGSNGKVSLFNSNGGNTHLVADVQGYFTDDADLTAVTPARLLDTRTNHSTDDGLFQKLGQITAGGQLDLTVAGRGGLPDSGVDSVILNVTATNPTAAGYITVWPTDNTQPATSNLNFVAGQTIANLVVSKVSAAGQVSLYNSAGSTDLIADVMGWFPTGSELTALQPARLLDNRSTGVTTDGQFQRTGALGPQTTLDFTVVGRGNVPASGVGAVVLNVTVTGPTQAGYLTVWPTGSTQPLASNLNFVAGQTIPNLVIVEVGDEGKVSLYNALGSSYVVADVVGWFPTTA